MIDGKSDSNTSKEYKDAVETPFQVAYTIKFAIKKGIEAIDYSVMPLEGLWWNEDMKNFSAEKKIATCFYPINYGLKTRFTFN